VTRADLREAARILAASILKVLVFNKDHRGARTAEDERLFSEIARALACSVLALHEKSNMQGLLDMGANPGWLPGYIPTSDESAIADLEKTGASLSAISSRGRATSRSSCARRRSRSRSCSGGPARER